MLRNFRHSVLAKVMTLLFITLLLAMAMGRIGMLVEERGMYQQMAGDELARTHAGSQRLVGPLLVQPYVEHWNEPQSAADGKPAGTRPRSQRLEQLVFPRQLHLEGTMQPQERYRGIFRIPFYTLQATVDGSFGPEDGARIVSYKPGGRIELLTPFIVWQVSDLRGLDGSPRLDADEQALAWRQGPPEPVQHGMGGGSLQAMLDGPALAQWRAGKPLPFRLVFSLVGQRTLSVVPLADETTAHIRSPWRSPSFGGDFLAAERRVDDTGFEARWRVSSLVTQARAQTLAQFALAPSTDAVDVARGATTTAGATATAANADVQPASVAAPQSFDVSLVEPLNVYALSERAGKYGLLFVVLVLLAAFTIEQLRVLRLHPVQYGLVGMSIALFFLLLLALSEKMAFWMAYASAASAGVLLLVLYFSAALGGWRRGVGFGAYVALLYAALYGLLVSEDNALLLGALLTFGLLAILMLATRRVDWYALSEARGQAPVPQRADTLHS